MRHVWLVLLAGVWAASGWPQTSSVESLDPLVVDPQHYHLEFQNQFVRVIRERMGPHESEPLHHHPEPGGVVVYLTDQNTRQTLPDGTTRVVRHNAGDVVWAPASTHKGENQNDAPFEYVKIEPKLPAGAASRAPTDDNSRDALIVDPHHFHLEFENDLVRAIRFTTPSHEKTPMHTHPQTGAVIVALTNQNTHQTTADGKERDIRHKAGEAFWGEPNIPHQDQNAGDAESVVIRIELKQAR